MAKSKLLEQVLICACLVLLMVIPGASVGGWMGGGSSNRKRVFRPGFVVLCVLVTVVELIALNHFYGAHRLGEGRTVRSKAD